MDEFVESKIVVFEHAEWNRVESEEFEFDIDASEQEIQQSFEDWVWGIIGDKVHWYEKEND